MLDCLRIIIFIAQICTKIAQYSTQSTYMHCSFIHSSKYPTTFSFHSVPIYNSPLTKISYLHLIKNNTYFTILLHFRQKSSTFATLFWNYRNNSALPTIKQPTFQKRKNKAYKQIKYNTDKYNQIIIAYDK